MCSNKRGSPQRASPDLETWFEGRKNFSYPLLSEYDIQTPPQLPAQSTYSAHARKNCVNFAFSPPVITIFVRHAADCKRAADPFSKRCDCRKHFRWTQAGRQFVQAAGTRSWAEAEELKRKLTEQLGGEVVKPEPERRTIRDAVDAFYKDRAVRGVSKMTSYLYKHDLDNMAAFCERAGVFAVDAVTRELLTALCASWGDDDATSQTRARRRDRVVTFLKFCFDSRWIERRPGMPKIRVSVQPTLPLDAEQYNDLLRAAETPTPKGPQDFRKGLRALIQLMRYSGLAIRDALMLPAADIVKCAGFYRVTTSRQKTGTHVSVPIPTAVAEEVLAVVPFWDGKMDPLKLVNQWTIRMGRTFTAAGLANDCFMKSHRLRDTFAVDLLQKGVPLEEVSKLLGHESIKTTEKSYAAWVRGRQDRLDALVTATWAAQ